MKQMNDILLFIKQTISPQALNLPFKREDGNQNTLTQKSAAYILQPWIVCQHIFRNV